ncbi:MAG: FtsQ-type POTRA domain-containing protein [Erysipelotrichaceae bacterium]|jgi:cell division protein FtsQ|nr:FtsQ-type POTRA domain-containing protein [Erysipelotrichaceae bacterium]
MSENQAVERFFRKPLSPEQTAARHKRRRLFLVFLFLLLVLTSGFLYLISPLARLKLVVVNGNQLLSREYILDVIDLKDKEIFFLLSQSGIAKKLEQDPLIADAIVTKSSDNTLVVTIVEQDIIGYRNYEEFSFLLANGEVIPFEERFASLLPYIPYISGFVGEELEGRLIRAFSVLDPQIRLLIAEVHQVQVSYDDKLAEILMQDGNRIYSSLNSFASLNYYFEIVNALRVENSCITIDEITGDAFSQSCDLLNQEQQVQEEGEPQE